MDEYSGYTQGTTYHIVCDAQGTRLDKEFEKLLKGLDHSISIWDSLSLVSQFNRSTDGIWADQHFLTAFEFAKKIHSETDGAFNPATYTLVQPKEKQDTLAPLSVDSLLKFSRFEDIYLGKNDSIRSSVRFISKRYPRSKISFEGLGQGYAVDIVCDFLNKKGIQNYRIQIGNISRTKGLDQYQKPWETSIDNPTPNNAIREIQAIIPNREKAIAIIGDYRQFYEKDGQHYNQYIDPVTGLRTENTLLCANVFAPTAAEAEAYGSAFMVMGAGKTTQFLARRRDLSAYLISSGFDQDFQTWISPELEILIEENK